MDVRLLLMLVILAALLLNSSSGSSSNSGSKSDSSKSDSSKSDSSKSNSSKSKSSKSDSSKSNSSKSKSSKSDSSGSDSSSSRRHFVRRVKPTPRSPPTTKKPPYINGQIPVTPTTRAGSAVMTANGMAASIAPDLVAKIKAIINIELQKDSDLVRKFVQLSFHDCFGGGCNGCINFRSRLNRALMRAVKKADEMRFSLFKSIGRTKVQITRGDFFALCGIAAVEFAGRNIGMVVDSVSRPFRFGRKSCANPWNPPRISHPEGFQTNGTAVLRSEFGVTLKEAVALLGAHSIGAMHTDVSGFGNGEWDLTPDVLEHGYFIELITANWNTERVKNSQIRSTQWRGTPPSERKPLLTAMHIDLSLMREFKVGSSTKYHQPSCTSTCSRASTADIVEEFADNVEIFREQFGSAFFKMVHTFP